MLERNDDPAVIGVDAEVVAEKRVRRRPSNGSSATVCDSKCAPPSVLRASVTVVLAPSSPARS